MPFPPKSDDKNPHGSDSQGSNVSKDHKDNPAHNAPASADHKDTMRQGGLTPNDAHRNQGDGHH